MNIIYNPQTKRFSDDLPSKVRLVKRFSDEVTKAEARDKVDKLKAELPSVKDPDKKKQLLKKIAKWTAIATGVGLVGGYMGREISKGYMFRQNQIEGKAHEDMAKELERASEKERSKGNIKLADHFHDLRDEEMKKLVNNGMDFRNSLTDRFQFAPLRKLGYNIAENTSYNSRDY